MVERWERCGADARIWLRVEGGMEVLERVREVRVEGAEGWER